MASVRCPQLEARCPSVMEYSCHMDIMFLLVHLLTFNVHKTVLFYSNPPNKHLYFLAKHDCALGGYMPGLENQEWWVCLSLGLGLFISGWVCLSLVESWPNNCHILFFLINGILMRKMQSRYAHIILCTYQCGALYSTTHNARYN